MHSRLLIIGFLFFISTHLFAQMKLDKELFYKSLSSNNLELIENELDKIDAISTPKQDAYKGALLMKKAGIEKKAGDKLKFFKEGKILLETAIEKNKQNVEWRFLRLMIQENAPKMLGYHTNINEDVLFINENINQLPIDLKNIIFDYSKSSKALKLNE